MIPQKNYKVRVILVFLAFMAIYVVLVTRLFLLQIHQKDFFHMLAVQQHQVTLTSNPARGLIFDRSGTVALAFNREVQSAFILPHQLKQSEKTKRFVQANYPDVFARMNENKERHFLWLERHLSPERAAWLKKNGTDDISLINEQKRFYPFESLAQLIGFTDIDNKGIAGIELGFDKTLQGVATQITIQRDARSGNHYFERAVDQEGSQGESLTLSIDSNLQFLAFEELKKTVDEYQAKLGSVMVMNPDTGEVLAIATYPTFDPNQKALPSLEVTKNNVVCECYELGSVIKAFSALAALEEGVVTLDEEIDCEGKVTSIDRFRVENWKSVGVLPFRDVMRMSSNVGTAKVAKRVGKKLYDHFCRVGFGKKTGIEFPGERDGFVNHPKNWSKPSIIVLSFGYETMISLVQLAQAFCLIANGGYLVRPTLLKKSKQDFEKRERLYQESTINQIQEILESIGTRYDVPGYRVMGKTGSARCAEGKGYSLKRGIYTFAGIVEKGNYRRVIITFVKEPEKHARWASEVAAPLFQRVAERMVLVDATKSKKR